MTRKYTLHKPIAAAVIYLVHEKDLPITIHEGNERRDTQGNRLVDVLLEYDDPKIVNDVITSVVEDHSPCFL